ncbi:SLOG family protein [Streptomyces canus]|uniref:SLOG family protein n=1 Tax=Streptomyces canus TaxID=58343 RepID=UPI0038B4C7D7
MNLAEPRVLVCGDRQWAWSATVAAVLDRLSARHGDRLVVIEGAASGANHAAHLWSERNGLGADCHRCHPVDWQTARRTRPKTWRLAGPERNTRMQLQERPQVIAFLGTSRSRSTRWPSTRPGSPCCCSCCDAEAVEDVIAGGTITTSFPAARPRRACWT